ncbi:MAG: CPXCG motif-containing cysteine-rich protein [Acidobacteriota bacterium]|nr:CPXCG motif-containing cysteine-rich protein [Acidobacteriota bacterium]MDH3522816.1 CPXCG motif-containing cysteine-rich protein [Acidobacteriota bacterium]
MTGGDSTLHSIVCPYCGEQVEIVLEEDLDGEMIWDCEVCCRPWELTVRGRGAEREVAVRTLEE